MVIDTRVEAKMHFLTFAITSPQKSYGCLHFNYEQDTLFCHPKQDGYLTVSSRVAQDANDILATRRKKRGRGFYS
jgi:hypothetical protein